ncbi:MAG: HK97 family phage prohead protease [Pseudomonadota bacterium]|nr:HK97 family phage prohead protease [Pseudomonadota bacterium]
MDFAGSPLELKHLNDSGAIEGLLAGFGNTDTHGDVIDPKAFSRTLAERKGAPLPMLLYHDQNRPVGIWREFEERAEGLYVKGVFTMAARDAQEAHALVKAGALPGLSIGYITRRAEPEGGVRRRLVEVDLREGSLVTIPSNPKSLVSSVKSIGSAKDIADLLREGGVSGREAKRAAGAAWRTLNSDSDAFEETELARVLQASIDRLAI